MKQANIEPNDVKARSLLRTAFTGVGLTLFILSLAIIAVLWSLPFALAEKLTHERHLVETVTACILGLAVLLGLRRFALHPCRPWAAAVVMLVWTVLRELDFHRQFGPRSFESIGFFLSETISVQIKLLVILVMAPFVVAGLYLFRLAIRHRSLLLRERPFWLRLLVVGIVYVLIARFFEKARIDRAHILEEVGEFTFSLFVLLTVYHFPRRTSITQQTVRTELNPGRDQLGGAPGNTAPS